MDTDTVRRKKRKSAEQENSMMKRSKSSEYADEDIHKAGKIKKVLMRNFMCHDALEIELNPNVNFIVGRNGSGKSAILTALTVGLGAKANITSRGNSVKDFIKKGKTSATIEVTLYNKGPMAYKPDIYGDIIIVNRTIGSSSQYKIKNYNGEIISKKRIDLERILQSLSIQIDNPIAVLNQDISRTFLVSSKPEEKYELFMRATLLDIIGNNYRDAETTCKDEYEKLKQYNEVLSQIRGEVEQLKINIKRAEQIDESREEVKQLERELHWAMVIAEERKLEIAKENYQKYENSVNEIQNKETSVESKCKEVDEQISSLEMKIKDAEQEVDSKADDYEQTRTSFMETKEMFATKSREWRSIQNKIKRFEDDKNTILKEIQRLENGENGEEDERIELKRQLADLEHKLDEVEAMLRTKKTDQMHLHADKLRLLKDIQNARIEVESYNSRIERLKRELNAAKMQTGNALTIFGRNIPRLLRRIDEEFANGTFHKKPRGPLGAYIKMKDPAWIPAAENFLSASMLSAFCVDDSHDAKALNAIIKEIFFNERPPQMICSKFYENIHNVRAQCALSNTYSNLLDAMDISDPVVANCLIDQREVECILLIPTSKEASELMSDARKVPRNCRRAITQNADTFYPDPHYRSYGGPANLRARFLQVSAREAIRNFEEELRIAENDKATAMQTFRNFSEKEKRTSSELNTVNERVAKLHAAQHQYKIAINDLRDKMDINEGLNVQVFKNELQELTTKLEQEKKEEARMGKIVLEFQRKVEDLEFKIKHYRELRQNLHTKIYPWKESIQQLQEQKQSIRMKASQAGKKLVALRQALQNATADLEAQQRVTDRLIEDAKKYGEKIQTKRPVREVERQLRDLRGRITEIERQFGTIDSLRKELKEKESKYGKNLTLAARIEKNYQEHEKRLKERRESYKSMKHIYGEKIQNSFSNVLKLRKKKGVITIDHSRKLLSLEVQDHSDKQRPTNDARSLSGGERSYSTVAFILALWDCTGLPFYFLDEFDVFMDTVNRRVIMDILLDHTKSHPQSQFTFLTPLDTSNIVATEYINIHQLAPPKRRGMETAT